MINIISIILAALASAGFAPAQRGEQVVVNPPPVVVEATGIFGLPFAPAELDGCDKVAFYAEQFGLPGDWTRRIAFRESRCSNHLTSSTGCCRGIMQLDVNLHLRDHRLGWRYRDNCGVNGISDVFGDDPLQWQKHMCAAKQLHDVLGSQPWNL